MDRIKAARLWNLSSQAWKERQQDLNYRDLLVWPNLNKLLVAAALPCQGNFLDLGCGDGRETRKLATALERMGMSGTLYGADQQRELLAAARVQESRIGGISVQFDHVSVSCMENRYPLATLDLVVANFLLQDLDNAEQAIKTTGRLLKPNRSAVFVAVHPDFGEAMNKKGALLEVQDHESADFLWSAAYPIVEEKGTFFVPYFHRSLAAYRLLFQKYFTVFSLLELRPDSAIIERCAQKHILPFCDSPENVYYPEIVRQPSSFIVVVTK